MRPADGIVLVAVLVMVGTVMMMVIVMFHFPFTAVEFLALAVLAALKFAVFSVYAGMNLMLGPAFAAHAVAQSFHAVLKFTFVVALSFFKVLSSVMVIRQQVRAVIFQRFTALIYDA